MKCVKCDTEMELQSKTLLEECYVCPNNQCNNRFSRSTNTAKAGVGAGIAALGLALFELFGEAGKGASDSGS